MLPDYFLFFSFGCLSRFVKIGRVLLEKIFIIIYSIVVMVKHIFPLVKAERCKTAVWSSR